MTAPERLDRLIARRARTDGDALAVVAEDASLTYARLDDQADRLAAVLAASGVQPGMLVGLAADRSAAAVSAVLAVWKLGAAYVPLDPDVPAPRRSKLAAIAGLTRVVSNDDLARLLDQAARVASAPVDGPGDATGLAYGIFTSGSTGGPKCVLVEHRSVWHLAQGLGAAVYAGSPDRLRIGVNGPLAFDTSVKQLVQLLAGHELHLVPAAIRADGRAMREFLAVHALDVIDVTPTQARSWLHHGVLDGLPTTLLVGGEAVDAGLWRRLAARAAAGQGRAFNLYGPTECTVDATAAEVVGDSPTIGFALPHVDVRIVDRRGRPVPAWVRGEIVIGGAGVARGYLGGSADDHARFQADPAAPGGRLYRTGDFARRRATGEIEFLEREDGQAKVAGVRIELAEVESELEALPTVAAAAAAVRREGDTAVLVAMVVAAGPGLDGQALRTELVDRVPAAMVPSAIEVVADLPRTANGKLDRAAVAAQSAARASSLTAAGPAPATATERVLAASFRELLHVDEVGAGSSFFALGGDSFTAVQLVGRVGEQLGREVPLRLVFLHPALGELAEAIDALGAFRSDLTVLGHEGAGAHPTEGRASRAGVERRLLLPLVAAGRLPRADAAAIACLPAELLAFAGGGARAAAADLTGGLPLLASIRTTAAGTLATILIPRFEGQLSASDQPAVVREVVEAMTMAQTIGARAVSLTGALPDATGLGRAVAAVTGPDRPAVTIGHPATAAAVVLAWRRLTADAAPAAPRVGFLGVGSVGAGALELALMTMPHPSGIVLCDVPSRADRVAALARRVVERYGYQGDVVCVTLEGRAPQELTACSTIVSTLHAPGVLDPGDVAHGTVVIDYSSGALDPAGAAHIRYADGGVLSSPAAIDEVRYVPPGAEAMVGELGVELAALANPFEINACSLAALLVGSRAGAPPVVGAPDGPACLRYFDAIQRLGFTPASGETVVTPPSRLEPALAR